MMPAELHMLVRDAMIPVPFVVPPDTTLFDFIDGILARNQTTASVVDGGQLVGIVSSSDVLKQLVPSYLAMDAKLANVLHPTFFEEHLDRLRSVLVRDVMSKTIDTLPPTASIMRAIALCVQSNRKTVPIVDGRTFVGAVTRRSVLTLVRSAANG